MDIAIIGWVWLGILVGVIAGFVLCSWLTTSKVAELESEIIASYICKGFTQSGDTEDG